MQTIVAEPILDLAEVTDGWEVIDVAIGPAHDPLVLLWERPRDLPAAPVPDHATVDAARQWRRTGLNRFRVVHVVKGRVGVVDLPKTRQNYLEVRAFGPNVYLLGSQRQRNEPNMDVFRSNGTSVRTFGVGEGITALQTSDDGELWVGYVDNASPRCGKLACFDREGGILLRFDEVARDLDLPEVFDCYALNVFSHDETWAWYSTGPGSALVRLAGRAVAGHWTGLLFDFPFGFAVAGTRILCHGGHNHAELPSQRGLEHTNDRFHLIDLQTNGVYERFPVDVNGKPLIPSQALGWGPRSHLAQGRGSRLYFESGDVLYAAEVPALPASARDDR